MTEDVKRPEGSQHQGNIGVGIFYGFGAFFLFRLAVALLSWPLSQLHISEIAYREIVYITGFFFGVVQLIYIIPLFLYIRLSGRPRTAKGLVISASIIALGNAFFWGVLYTSRPWWH